MLVKVGVNAFAVVQTLTAADRWGAQWLFWWVLVMSSAELLLTLFHSGIFTTITINKPEPERRRLAATGSRTAQHQVLTFVGPGITAFLIFLRSSLFALNVATNIYFYTTSGVLYDYPGGGLTLGKSNASLSVFIYLIFFLPSDCTTLTLYRTSSVLLRLLIVCFEAFRLLLPIRYINLFGYMSWKLREFRLIRLVLASPLHFLLLTLPADLRVELLGDAAIGLMSSVLGLMLQGIPQAVIQSQYSQESTSAQVSFAVTCVSLAMDVLFFLSDFLTLAYKAWDRLKRASWEDVTPHGQQTGRNNEVPQVRTVLLCLLVCFESVALLVPTLTLCYCFVCCYVQMFRTIRLLHKDWRVRLAFGLVSCLSVCHNAIVLGFALTGDTQSYSTFLAATLWVCMALLAVLFVWDLCVGVLVRLGFAPDGALGMFGVGRLLTFHITPSTQRPPAPPASPAQPAPAAPAAASVGSKGSASRLSDSKDPKNEGSGPASPRMSEHARQHYMPPPAAVPRATLNTGTRTKSGVHVTLAAMLVSFVLYMYAEPSVALSVLAGLILPAQGLGALVLALDNSNQDRISHVRDGPAPAPFQWQSRHCCLGGTVRVDVQPLLGPKLPPAPVQAEVTSSSDTFSTSSRSRSVSAGGAAGAADPDVLHTVPISTDSGSAVPARPQAWSYM
jgi:hypothetical protein